MNNVRGRCKVEREYQRQVAREAKRLAKLAKRAGRQSTRAAPSRMDLTGRKM